MELSLKAITKYPKLNADPSFTAHVDSGGKAAVPFRKNETEYQDTPSMGPNLHG